MTTQIGLVKKKTARPMSSMPNGSLVRHRGQIYFVSDGPNGRMVTDKNGDWLFLCELRWESFSIIYMPQEV